MTRFGAVAFLLSRPLPSKLLSPGAGAAALLELGTRRASLNDLVPYFSPLPLAGRVKAAPYFCFPARLGRHGEARGASGARFSFVETGSPFFLPSCAGAGSFGFCSGGFAARGSVPWWDGGSREEVGVGSCFALGCSERPGVFLVGSGEGGRAAPGPAFCLGWAACAPE